MIKLAEVYRCYPGSFKLQIFFDPNPYFEGSLLTKTYCMKDDGRPYLEQAEGYGHSSVLNLFDFIYNCLLVFVVGLKSNDVEENA